MNEAHLHMVVNHFPIIGTILAIGILIAGLLSKNRSIINTSYVLFVIGAIFGILSMNTGEGAEELVEDMPSVGKQIIHEHEEMAEKLAVVLYVLGVISLCGLFLNYKNNLKPSFRNNLPVACIQNEHLRFKFRASYFVLKVALNCLLIK